MTPVSRNDRLEKALKRGKSKHELGSLNQRKPEVCLYHYVIGSLGSTQRLLRKCGEYSLKAHVCIVPVTNSLRHKYTECAAYSLKISYTFRLELSS